MDLSDSIKKAAQQQVDRKPKDVDHTKKSVKLGSGRTSNYQICKVGRPANEQYKGEFHEGQIINE